jgi:hypothetical protein
MIRKPTRGDYAEGTERAIECGRMGGRARGVRKSHNQYQVIPPEVVDEILATRATGETQRTVAARFGVHPSTVCALAKRHRQREA